LSGSVAGGWASRLARSIKDVVKRHFYPDWVLARRQYFYRNGFYPDLDDPRDLSEKVLWLKLHDRSPLHTQCADKIRVRDYVNARLGPELLVPSILVTYDPKDIVPEAIAEERFVVKTNHDQGGVFICRDRAGFDWPGVRAQLMARSKTNKYYEYRERQYKDIVPGILVERFVEGENGRDAIEVKINCFHGVPGFVQVIVDRFTDRRQVIYAPDWSPLPIHGRSPPVEGGLPRPERLDHMLRDAAELARPFLFCRVDFLLGTGGRPWFSEITFHPAAGLVRYRPPEMERALGDMIDLSRLEESRRLQRALAPGADHGPLRRRLPLLRDAL
jgi:hypothetical protein